MGGAAFFDDETLMRFADGELDDATLEAVATAIEADPALAQRVALFAETRRRAKSEFSGLLDEPVPDRLTNSVQAMIDAKRTPAASVVPFTSRAAPTVAAPRGSWRLPIAATLAAALLGAAGGYWAAGGNTTRPVTMAGLDASELDSLLRETLTGNEVTAGGGRFRIINSFRDSARTFCREYEVDRPSQDTFVSVACHADGTWLTRFAVLAPADSGGYAPASSVEALDAYLSAIGASAPFAAEEEKAALAALSN